MTEARIASNEALSDLMRGDGSTSHYRSTAAITHALHDIADAIRGLTPNATQDVTGCPQNDPQPEPGQLDGDRGAEDVMGDPGQSRHVMVSRDALDAMGTYRRSAIQRAEKAEAERDAILNELRDLRG